MALIPIVENLSILEKNIKPNTRFSTDLDIRVQIWVFLIFTFLHLEQKPTKITDLEHMHTLWNWKLKWLTQVNRIRFGRQRVRRGITMNTRTNQNSCRLMLIFICGNEMQEL
uniref:Uncharacterized protein n=1 Tax=Helianthus annuus TaxID=4232 RepID=A0A251TJI6_HELAN